MAQVEIYASMFCGFCYRAKRLLDTKGIAYDEIDVTMNPVRRGEMRERAGGQNAVPQNFIDGRHIGGSDELLALEAEGGLEALRDEKP